MNAGKCLSVEKREAIKRGEMPDSGVGLFPMNEGRTFTVGGEQYTPLLNSAKSLAESCRKTMETMRVQSFAIQGLDADGKECDDIK